MDSSQRARGWGSQHFSRRGPERIPTTADWRLHGIHGAPTRDRQPLQRLRSRELREEAASGFMLVYFRFDAGPTASGRTEFISPRLSGPFYSGVVPAKRNVWRLRNTIR